MSNSLSNPAYKIENVSRYFGEHVVVKDLNLEISTGEIIGLLGLNGAGKSTCLQMLAGTLAPSLGEVRLFGQDLYSGPASLRERIGYLPEQPPLYAHQKVDEYLNFIVKLYAVDKQQRAHRIAHCKQQCGLQDVGKRRIGNLSKGFQQRLGIAQAIVHQPEIIILDEPTVGLDPQQLMHMRKVVRELGEQTTVIFSSHILSEVHAVADRIVILHQGHVVHDGPNEDKSDLEELFSRIIFADSTAQDQSGEAA
ncbi:MAG: ABC transporter ATP-binding protein [Gammaproteobacteria bacterium]|nr:ABC transporter ATP-binding protein [Gammaproteobacteria bacterium]NNC98461.1 ABC transporter ATP-binding protein [Gammaproteobacteria bacterium]NNM14768.1 ABC transporter ATP-binding protein [Gammaproteobacteria bacterium]